MGLKDRSCIAREMKAFKLKSDQNGIERLANVCSAPFCFELKSDQNGIESKLQRRSCNDKENVEIRPKWDWKTIITSPYVSAGIAALKSDQNGIERRFLQRRQQHWELSWNQTKMGLKDHIVRIGLSIRVWVEIRPKWDWKTQNNRGTKNVAISWNQTKMGLKVGFDTNRLYRWYRVEIRPKWDWK